MKHLKTLICGLALLLSAGCVSFNPASSGMKVSDDAMTTIRDNVDTKDTVASKLGQPTRKTAKDGKDFWYYDFKVMGSNLKITEQETTTFEFNTNTGILLSHYKGNNSGASTSATGAVSSSSTTPDSDDWCQQSVYKQAKGQLPKAKLDVLFQKCTADCKATFDKYKGKSDLAYTTTMYKSCTTAYMPGGAYYNAAQREK